jgi:hypothetical protein
MTHRQTYFFALIFLATVTACVVPGLATPTAPSLFAPTTDPGRLETMVAATVSAAIAETEQARPTPTLVSTSEPTQTATSEPITSGSTLTLQDDGATVFVDERAGYQITIPDGWLAVRVNEKEYYDAWNLAEAADPNIQAILLDMKAADPNIHRLRVIDTQDGHIQSDFVTDISFNLNEQRAFNSIEDLQAIANELPDAPSAFSFEVATVQTIIAPSGIQFGVIEATSSFTNTSGDLVNIYLKQIVFKVKNGSQSVVFLTVEGLKESTLPAFDSMIETIKLNP